jgi:hypothetical protein
MNIGGFYARCYMTSRPLTHNLPYDHRRLMHLVLSKADTLPSGYMYVLELLMELAIIG